MPFVKGHTPIGAHSRAKRRVDIDMTPEMTARLVGIQSSTPRYTKVFRAAYSGKSRPAAIKAFCVWCMGYVASEITGCTAKDCPLYHYRPYRTKANKEL